MRWVYDICVSDCRALPPFSGRRSIRRARNLLRFAGRAAGFRATDSRWIDEALRQLAASDALAQTCVASVDGELHVYRGEIHLVAPAAGIPDAPLRWSGQRELSWAGGRLRFVTVRGAGIGVRNLAGAEVCVAARCGGERLQPEARRPRHCVRKLLQDKNQRIFVNRPFSRTDESELNQKAIERALNDFIQLDLKADTASLAQTMSDIVGKIIELSLKKANTGMFYNFRRIVENAVDANDKPPF